MKQDLERILFSEEEIERAVDELAARVSDVLSGQPVTVVSVLKGSCIFSADLVRRLDFALELGFAVAESYRDGTESGPLALPYFPNADEVAGRDVLLVDDILDSGRTLARLRRELLDRDANSVRTCVLLDKPARRIAEQEADFRCFQVDDVFVVGYGLDYAGQYRNLPFVAELSERAIRQPAGTTEDER